MERLSLDHMRNKKIALVLSGGVVKAAAWHLGVAMALEELGFTFKSNAPKQSDLMISTYVGSSAGALVNLMFASGLHPVDIIQAHLNNDFSKTPPITYKDMLHIRRPIKRPPQARIYDPLEGFPLIIKKLIEPFYKIDGLFTTQGLANYLTKNIILSNNYEDYNADLFTVATQLDNSRKCIFSKYNYPNPEHDSTAHYYTGIPIVESVASSMSVPPFYAPYPIKNKITNQIDYYIDGEIRETLSTHVAIDNGCEYIISSWTHTPYHYHDEIGSLVNYGLPAIGLQSIYLLIQKKIVASRAKRANAKDIIDTIHKYLVENKFSKSHQRKILSILERKLNYDPKVKLIDIYPKHNDYQIFFKNSFSLNPNNMSEVVRLGFRRTVEVFKNKEWLR
jgi:predicted acylesterase/phospholipase RssA